MCNSAHVWGEYRYNLQGCKSYSYIIDKITKPRWAWYLNTNFYVYLDRDHKHLKISSMALIASSKPMDKLVFTTSYTSIFHVSFSQECKSACIYMIGLLWMKFIWITMQGYFSKLTIVQGFLLGMVYLYIKQSFYM